MSVDLGKGSSMLVLGILGAVLGSIYYYSKKKTDADSGEGRWIVGDTLSLGMEEYSILDKKWRQESYVFAGDDQLYSRQWWYKLSNGGWFPEDWLEESLI